MERKIRTFTTDEQMLLTQTVGEMSWSEPEDGYVKVMGQAAVYGNWFLVAEDGGVMIQRRNNPGMFARALSQSPNVVLKVDHQVPLARTGAKTLKIWETPDALMFQGLVNTNTTAGRDLVENMKSGLYTQSSVKYWALKDYPKNPERTPDGKMVHYQDIAEGKLHGGDVTICMEGMNPECAASLAQARAVSETPLAADYDLLRRREVIRLQTSITAGAPLLR